MIERVRRALVPLNTHPIGWGGFVLATIGILTPSTVDWLFPHFDAGVRASLHEWGRLAAQVGAAAALVGRAPQIKGSP